MKEEDYNCNPIENMLSHQLQKDVIDGPKGIIQNPNEAQRYFSFFLVFHLRKHFFFHTRFSIQTQQKSVEKEHLFERGFRLSEEIFREIF